MSGEDGNAPGATAAPEVERSPSGTTIVGGVVVPKGLEGVPARDPGIPPAIFLLVTPSPRQARGVLARLLLHRTFVSKDSKISWYWRGVGWAGDGKAKGGVGL